MMIFKQLYILFLIYGFLFSLVSCQYEEDSDNQEEEENQEQEEEEDEDIADSTGSSNATRDANGTTAEVPVEATTRRIDNVLVPVAQLLKNVGKGNITGIVDQALSIRTPQPIREMVNMILSTVFGGMENIGKQMGGGMEGVAKQVAAGMEGLAMQSFKLAEAVQVALKSSTPTTPTTTAKPRRYTNRNGSPRPASESGSQPTRKYRIRSTTRRNRKSTTTTTPSTYVPPTELPSLDIQPKVITTKKTLRVRYGVPDCKNG